MQPRPRRRRWYQRPDLSLLIKRPIQKARDHCDHENTETENGKCRCGADILLSAGLQALAAIVALLISIASIVFIALMVSPASVRTHKHFKIISYSFTVPLFIYEVWIIGLSMRPKQVCRKSWRWVIGALSLASGVLLAWVSLLLMFNNEIFGEPQKAG